ncbi:hypothetical protein [Nocardia jejuensis]|uniref:hypothetical protein n=1 Tax=Nocardia jejuensis TaxID=328049 RepID=UPI0008342066|nr:hypothetical protein [Nocardia jejuensis]
MLLEKKRWAGIQDGSVTVLFRRWRTPQTTAGQTYRTGAGRIVVEAQEIVRPGRIRLRDARAAGYDSVAAVLADLRGEDSDPIHLLRIRMAQDADPRAELAASDQLTDGDIATLTAKLTRMDTTSPVGPWTLPTLRLIERFPATRAPDLAARAGRDTAKFKVDVRKLKNLGLTYSLDIGYRLSPRGIAYLRTQT